MGIIMNFKQYIIKIVLFFIFSFLTPLHALIDLEGMAMDYILETKKVDIPEYPYAFNASIIRWKGSLLMSFRIIPNPLFSFHSRMGLVWLNEDFSPKGPSQLL